MTIPSQERVQYLGDQFSEVLSIPSHVAPKKYSSYLVPEIFWGLRFYNYAYFPSGYVRSIFWGFHEFFSRSPQLRESTMRVSVETTVGVWEECLKDLTAVGKCFEKELKKSMTSVLPKAINLKRGEREILNRFYFAVIKVFQGNGKTVSKIVKEMAVFFKSIQGTYTSSFKNIPQIIDDAEFDYFYLKLQRAFKSPIPVDILLNIAEASKENASKKLEIFVKQIAALHLKGDINVREFIGALFALMKRGHKDKFYAAQLFFELNEKLRQKNCNIFLTRDPIYCRWLEKMLRNPEATFTCTHSVVNIDQEFPGKEEGVHRVFTVAGDSSLVLTFSTLNQALPLINFHAESAGGRTLPIAKTEWIGSKGFSLVERVTSETLAEYPWKKDADANRLRERKNAFAAFLYEMSTKNFTPQNLSASTVCFNPKNELKFLRFFEDGEFDFYRVVNFVYDCVKGDDRLYIELILMSKFNQHPLVQLNQELMTLALNGRSAEIEPYLISKNFSVTMRAYVLQKAKELQKIVDEILKECCSDVKERYEFQAVEFEEFEKVLKTTIINRIAQVGILPHASLIKKNVIAKCVLQCLPPLLKKSLLEERYQKIRDFVAIEWGTSTGRAELINRICRRFGVYHQTQIEEMRSRIKADMTS